MSAILAIALALGPTFSFALSLVGNFFFLSAIHLATSSSVSSLIPVPGIMGARPLPPPSLRAAASSSSLLCPAGAGAKALQSILPARLLGLE